MNCEILKILYLRSNGEIPCNCAAGERINLGWAFDDSNWNIAEVFENANYNTIRESFSKGKAPWGSICENCAFFVPQEPMDDQLRNRRIEKFHIEPALTCALQCPGCSRADQIKRRKPPFVLSESILQRVLDSIVENDFEVESLFYCGQGEPLNHPRFQTLAGMTKKALPKTPQTVFTNGNFAFSKIFDPSNYLPESFVISADGLFQENYEKYRVNGDIKLALQFMKDLKSIPNPPYVEWKYILFTYNDSNEEIKRAQEKAIELGVDRITFVLTHSIGKSERYTYDNIDELDLLPGIGFHSSTPHLYYERELAELVSTSRVKVEAGVALEIESFSRNNGGLVILQVILKGIDHKQGGFFEVSIDGETMGMVDLNRLTESKGSFPVVLTKKNVSLEKIDHEIACRLLEKDTKIRSEWSYKFSFAEASLHTHTATAR